MRSHCAVIVFITVRFHLLMRVFPMQQLTATVFAILALYQFVLFWINGVVGIDAPPVKYWGPVISGTLFWPVVSLCCPCVRLRVRTMGAGRAQQLDLLSPIKDHHSERRLFIGRVVLASVVSDTVCWVAVVARLVQLQVFEYEVFAEQSQGNRVRIEAMPPIRGPDI